MKTTTYIPRWSSALTKSLALFTLFFALTLPVLGQHSIVESPESKSFIGIGVSTTGYYLPGKPKYEYMAGVTPFLTIHYGYSLSKRATIQAGLGYGANESSHYTTRYVSADEIYEVHAIQNLRAVVVPVTLKFTPLNPHRKLQLYANATLAPTVGRIKASATESIEGSSLELYNEETSAFNMVATGGLTLNYKMTSRLEGFVDGMLFYKNLHSRGTLHNQKPMSVGIGLNYRLK
ncbi:outer membrane beta-barrel protein [Pontibacter roseus]|uniref:outer membrane beta-barrel protein n=1 Tax=Pontibacter roseus TaxID=336989 RepID=UPI000524B302|nr:outer membrane beta-barrel protein [Pontibacter roseus]